MASRTRQSQRRQVHVAEPETFTALPLFTRSWVSLFWVSLTSMSSRQPMYYHRPDLPRIIRQEQERDPECRALAKLTHAEFDLNDAVEHFPRTAGHPGITRIFRSLRSRFFLKGKYADDAEAVKQSAAYAKNRIHGQKRKSFLKLFSASEPL
jgi:hypothetical protein